MSEMIRYNHPARTPDTDVSSFDISLMRKAWAKTGFVHLPDFILGTHHARVLAEARRILENARRRDFNMRATGNTPRHMSILSADEIQRASSSITSLYSAPRIRELISSITRTEIETASTMCERFVLNRLHVGGDVHGEHLDDFPLAFVILLAVPPPGNGGELTFTDLCGVRHELALQCGDSYLLRSDRSLHGVAPIQEGERIALVMSFNIKGHDPIITQSAQALYE